MSNNLLKGSFTRLNTDNVRVIDSNSLLLSKIKAEPEKKQKGMMLTAEPDADGFARGIATDVVNVEPSEEIEEAGLKAMEVTPAEEAYDGPSPEELIEEAVRKELGLSKTDKITASMLEDVRKLRIVGKEILDDEDTFWGEGHHVDGKDSSFGSVRGNITDLSDLAQMVNLEELALCNQKIEDISGLKELPLKKLYLSKNMITDFSVLLNLIDLDTLWRIRQRICQ